MSENTNNIPAQPVYIMQPQQQSDTNIFNGFGGFVLFLRPFFAPGQKRVDKKTRYPYNYI